ncbi:hypothetical protein [Thermospira aquatica]|uniref:Uncharacterized protein n=1 Tax=Thermospira aquatica TaxID=2828656 RepID=A0AAX3BFP4_9SPIR|nr:hypothetical protein [Thermospira aquatica]URA11104.1 hypothetical protein KDW03_04725 [Thermospira aquatica]
MSEKYLVRQIEKTSFVSGIRLEDFLVEVKKLIVTCQKKRSIEPFVQLPENIKKEITETAFLLSEEWSKLFLSLILHKNIEALVALEGVIIESATREVMEALKNMLELVGEEFHDSPLQLYKLRRIYYTLVTYYSEDEPMIGYDILLYRPGFSFSWIHCLEDLL